MVGKGLRKMSYAADRQGSCTIWSLQGHGFRSLKLPTAADRVGQLHLFRSGRSMNMRVTFCVSETTIPVYLHVRIYRLKLVQPQKGRCRLRWRYRGRTTIQINIEREREQTTRQIVNTESFNCSSLERGQHVVVRGHFRLIT